MRETRRSTLEEGEGCALTAHSAWSPLGCCCAFTL